MSAKIKQLRHTIVNTWNATFYFHVGEGFMFESRGVDVWEAMTKFLEYVAIEDIQLARKDSIQPIAIVALDPDPNEWTLIPIGPAYRQCSPIVQSIVRRTLEATFPELVDAYLQDGDVESFEQVIEDAKAISNE